MAPTAGIPLSFQESLWSHLLPTAALDSELIARIAAAIASAPDQPPFDVATAFLSNSLDSGDRKEKGQVFTPRPIARLMVRWACASGATSFLDPSVGPGVFLQELLDSQIVTLKAVHAFELHPTVAAIAESLFHRQFPALSLRTEDFVLASADCRYDAIVANPPYVRHHNLTYPPEVFEQIGSLHGITLSRLTNLYGLFLLRALRLLTARGRLAFVTPAEFLNADFGSEMKKALLKMEALDAVLYFDHARLVFEDALTTAAITLVDKGRDPACPVRLIHVGPGADLDEILQSLLDGTVVPSAGHGWKGKSIAMGELDPSVKWGRHFYGGTNGKSGFLSRLGDFATTRRGIATGANDYFTLTDAELRSVGLSEQEVAPCITKAVHAPYPEFIGSDVAELRDQGKKVWITDLREPLSAAAASYIDKGRQAGIAERYLPAARRPWFSTERVQIAPIWATVFGRGQFRFVLNSARIRNLTTFHGIYPKFAAPELIRALAAILLSRWAQNSIKDSKRVYGGGLDKIEPRDLLDCNVPDPRALKPTIIDELNSLHRELDNSVRRGDDAARSLIQTELDTRVAGLVPTS